MEQITLNDGQTVPMLDMAESQPVLISQSLHDELRRKFVDTRWSGFVVVYDPRQKHKWHFAYTDGHVTDRRLLLGVEYPHLPQDHYTIKETAEDVGIEQPIFH